MKKQKTSRVFLMLALLSILLGVTAVAQSPKDVKKKGQPIAEVGFDRLELKWKPHVEFESLVLTVSQPDGEVIRQEFAAGVAPTFKLVDEKGAPLPDGYYNYELRLTPNLDAEVKESLKAAEAEDNRAQVERALKNSGKLPKESLIQHGAFLIEKGALFMGDSTEGAIPQRVSSRMEAPTAPLNGRTEFFAPVKAVFRPFDEAINDDLHWRLAKAALAGAFRPFDQVIPDDLIVQGSACIGLDCVNNESFGFDTIRLKENNTRIKFQDTSVGSFPTTDWQLTANDSASGGANKFSIEDITGARVPFTITGNAPTNSIFVDSSGRLGLRTSTPVLDVHVNTSNTPAHRLEQNSSGGFTAQTWDVAGNEANFFVRDVTGGSRLPFRIRPGAPTSSIDISASGNVGFGTASPSASVHASRSDGSYQYKMERTGTNAHVYGFGADSNGLFLIDDVTNVARRLTIDTSGNLGIGTGSPAFPIQHANGAFLSVGGAWTNASSKALKMNIHSLSSRAAFAALQQMNPVTFQYKANPSEHHVGFIAEEVPELVATTDRKGISPMDVVAVLTKVVQEQQQVITDLKVKVELLEKVQVKKTRRLKK